MAQEPSPKPLTTREILERAHPTVDSPTYRLLTGQIDEAEYQRLLNLERVHHGLPAIRPETESRGPGRLSRLRSRLRSGDRQTKA